MFRLCLSFHEGIISEFHFDYNKLKEYAFSQAAQAVELDSREAKKVLFQATRVAYRGFAAITYALLFCPLLLQQEMSQVTIYGSDLLILLAYAPSMTPLLSLPLPMACDDSDGLNDSDKARLSICIVAGQCHGCRDSGILVSAKSKYSIADKKLMAHLPLLHKQSSQHDIHMLRMDACYLELKIPSRSRRDGSYDFLDHYGDAIARPLFPS
ncbi:hypothetical protein Tco_1392540 [Tanacetum coccineum]